MDKHRHQYEFRYGVMTSPACVFCGKTPTTTRIKLVEPRNKRAILVNQAADGNFPKIWVLE